MKRMGELSAQEIMTCSPICVSETAKLSEAIRELDEHDISALPVVDGGNRVVGILSLFDVIEVTREIQGDLSALAKVGDETRDFLIRLLSEQGENTLVQDVMTKPVETIRPETNAVIAARKMIEGGFRHLPVVDHRGHPLGIISTTDFVKAFADQGALLAG